MLWTIFVILAVMWLLGMVSSYTMGGFIHILLVAAVILMVFNLLQGRRPLSSKTGSSGATLRPWRALRGDAW